LSSDNYKWLSATIKTDPWRQLPTKGHFEGEDSLFFAEGTPEGGGADRRVTGAKNSDGEMPPAGFIF
jgi:hypothetical protein